MKKKFLIFSIVCLLFCTLNYTYSSFKNTIVGNINGNIKNWVFKVNIDNSTKYNDSYKLHLSGTSGSFNININTTGGVEDADYIIELIGDSSIKYYTDSAYTSIINNNIYKSSIDRNSSSSITIYYKASSNINSDILIKAKGSIMKIAMMKNGYSDSSSVNGGTEFWNKTYKSYIRSIELVNNLSNLPSSCTAENLCWDISYDGNQENKVYAYLIDSGLKSSSDTTKALYNLYIVSEAKILAPSNSSSMFKDFTNLIQINFNNNFSTLNTVNMANMFNACSSLENLNLSNFNTQNVTDINSMFYDCSSLTSLDLSNFNTSKVTDMNGLFYNCSSLTSLDLSNFNTSKVTDMSGMFWICSSLTSLDLSSFNVSNVTNMYAMFQGCSSLKTFDLSNFNASKVTNMANMIRDCSSLTSLNLDGFNTTSVTDMNGMFYGCSSLTSLNLISFDVSKVTDMSGMFFECSSLIKLNLGSFNSVKLINTGYMFYGCPKLQTEINIKNASLTSYSGTFSNALSDSNASVIINYVSAARTIAQNIKNTCSSSYRSKITLKQI